MARVMRHADEKSAFSFVASPTEVGKCGRWTLFSGQKQIHWITLASFFLFAGCYYRKKKTPLIPSSSSLECELMHRQTSTKGYLTTYLDTMVEGHCVRYDYT